MKGLQFAVAVSTLALATALPRSPDFTPREQQVFEYFPDYRYVDPMENPAFMTEKCTSEGVFPHPYNCTWFYRCHDRTGHGFFTTNWFYCEPGTEFDDDLDQCIPKSGTCGSGEDLSFCRTLTSSCRSCNTGSSQLQLCEFKECFNGGRDAGIVRICEEGQQFDGQNCVAVSGCPPPPPPVPGSPTGECPLNKMRPAAKWTDEASGCSVFTGCRAGRNYQETLCSSFYDCHRGTKVQRTCPNGYFFSKQWELCIQPPQQDCSGPAPPKPPTPVCSLSQGIGQDCQNITGCFSQVPNQVGRLTIAPPSLPSPPQPPPVWLGNNGNPQSTTKRLCSHYTCPQTGSQKYYCPSGSFSYDTKTCYKSEECPLGECLPENAVRWQSCQFYTGYRYPSMEKISLQQLCDVYSCSQTGGLRPCGPGDKFEPTTKTCMAELTPILVPSCTADLATSWEGCTQVSKSCPNDDFVSAPVEECQVFKCSANEEYSSCPSPQVFNPAARLCVPPKPEPICSSQTCTADRAAFWGVCKDVTGCSVNNPTERTENQCETFSCSITGQEFRCEGGQVFSPDQRTCVEPLNEASCPCTAERAQFWGVCEDVTGCSSDNSSEQTENQCETFSCSITGQEYRCEGGQVFSPDQRTCVEPLNEASCPCTAERAQFWGVCEDVTGCSADNSTERTENQCETFSCSITGQEFRCEGGQVFSPDQRTCMEPLNEASCPCTAERAQFWGVCEDVTGCSADNSTERTENQCETFSCSITGQEFRCEGGQVFSPDQRTCVEPLNEASCPCTAERAQFWGVCEDVTGCSADNPTERTENQCQTFSCSITGQEFRCEGGQVFSPDQRTCVEPLNDASCPCTIERAQDGISCKTVTGCTQNDPNERTEQQCDYFICSNTGSSTSCDGGQVYNPDTRSCVEPLDAKACPVIPDVCTPDQAKKWTSCQDRCNDDGSKTEMCYHFTCTDSLNDKVPCIDDGQFTEMFDPTTKTCKPKRNDCPRAASAGLREGCSPDQAQFWFDCSNNQACKADRYPLQQQSLCSQYSCEAEKISCSSGQMYDSKSSACVTPLTGKYCHTGIPQQQPKVTLKSWNNQWN